MYQVPTELAKWAAPSLIGQIKQCESYDFKAALTSTDFTKGQFSPKENINSPLRIKDITTKQKTNGTRDIKQHDPHSMINQK